jgi:Lon protease-like protein
MPLFPLGTVLFDGGQLPLRIFEPRYIDMISRCMKAGSGFGVVLIRAGSEVRAKGLNQAPRVFSTGTEARIEDFNPLSDGALGIVARGGRKVAVKETRQQSDGLLVAEIEYLPEEPFVELQAATGEGRFDALIEILKELIRHPMIEKMDLEFDFTDARSVGWRLAELLPIEAEIKQSLLQMQLPRERLVELVRIVNKLKG